jgi:hypothetical protein
VIGKVGPAVCGGGLLKANSKYLVAQHSAFALQSQSLEELRVRRLVRVGLSISIATAVAPLIYGEVR